MKKEVFNEYLRIILDRFELTEELFFTNKGGKQLKAEKKAKEEGTDFVWESPPVKQARPTDDIRLARWFLYYLCYIRGIKAPYICKYMKDYGFDLPESTFWHSYRKMKNLYLTDHDYKKIIDHIEGLV
jgi:hypothetical protein